MVYLRVLLAAGRTAEVNGRVADQLPYASAAENSDQRIQLLVLGALACVMEGECVTADDWIRAELELATPRAVRRPF